MAVVLSPYGQLVVAVRMTVFLLLLVPWVSGAKGSRSPVDAATQVVSIDAIAVMVPGVVVGAAVHL